LHAYAWQEPEWSDEQKRDLVGLLVQAGADIDARDEGGATPLVEACSADGGDPAIIAAMIEHGADVNAGNEDGNTVLHHAVHNFCNGEEVVPVLLRHGADAGRRNGDHLTPLELARVLLRNWIESDSTHWMSGVTQRMSGSWKESTEKIERTHRRIIEILESHEK